MAETTGPSLIQGLLSRARPQTAERSSHPTTKIKDIKPSRDIFTFNAPSEPSKNEILFLKQVIMQEKEAQK
jgi:hypothetical protein